MIIDESRHLEGVAGVEGELKEDGRGRWERQHVLHYWVIREGKSELRQEFFVGPEKDISWVLRSSSGLQLYTRQHLVKFCLLSGSCCWKLRDPFQNLVSSVISNLNTRNLTKALIFEVANLFSHILLYFLAS